MLENSDSLVARTTRKTHFPAAVTVEDSMALGVKEIGDVIGVVLAASILHAVHETARKTKERVESLMPRGKQHGPEQLKQNMLSDEHERTYETLTKRVNKQEQE